MRNANDLLYKYNLTIEQYEMMIESQSGVCAICSNPPGMRGFCIDHDHKTGLVRGLLCNKCNSALGLFGDSIRILAAAIVYLEDHGKTYRS
jgi:hypothetical protein